MSKSPSRVDRPPIQHLRMVVDLLETPGLARVYAHVLQEGPVTVGEIIEAVDVPQGTAYEYVEKLEAAGVIERIRDQRPYEYEAEPISLTLSTDGDTRTITPALIAAAARRENDEDIDVFIERHGLDGLATALVYASEYVEGSVTHRIMARELDLSPIEAEVILQALEPIAEEYAVTTDPGEDSNGGDSASRYRF